MIATCARASRKEGKEKAFQFMVRVQDRGRQAHGRRSISPCDHLAQTIGNGTLRITTRQEFQLHGVLKHDLTTTIRQINEVAAVDAGRLRRRRAQRALLPRPGLRCAARGSPGRCAAPGQPIAPRGRRAYWEIWLDGEKIETLPPAGPRSCPPPGDDPVEPLYGKAYLPRKFKTAFALPDDNCTDIHANDLGFLAVVDQDAIAGYNVLVGGGLGTTPSAQKTFPFLAVPLCYVGRDQVLEIGEAVLKVFRDFGNRSDRKRARLKYIIHDWGSAGFRAKIEEYLGRRLDEPRPLLRSRASTITSAGTSRATASCSSASRSKTAGSRTTANIRLATGLRAFFEKYQTPARLTCQQSILLCDIEPAGAARSSTGSKSTALPRSSRFRPSAAGRWLAPPCPPAVWRLPRPSVPFPSLARSARSRARAARARP